LVCVFTSALLLLFAPVLPAVLLFWLLVVLLPTLVLVLMFVLVLFL